METKEKHLEFIQTAITRMANNSFLLRGWAVSLVAAVFALSIKEVDAEYLMVSLTVLAFFWALDGYYLALERAFVRLYRDVGKGPAASDFSMDISSLRRNGDWLKATFSRTCLLFYGGLALVHLLVLTRL